MSYKIGDKILYPMHGAGVIEAIEEKEILGETKSYYVMRMPSAVEMKVMLPVTNLKEIGVRELIDKTEAKKVIKSFTCSACKEDSNWNKRYRDNLAKIKSGNIYDVLDVVKNLLVREHEKGLSSGERKMFSNAKHILFSELILTEAATADELEKKLETAAEKLMSK